MKFRRNGGSYARANEVAQSMGLSIDKYLFKCIQEGHKTLKARMDADLELPEWMRESPDAQTEKTNRKRRPISYMYPDVIVRKLSAMTRAGAGEPISEEEAEKIRVGPPSSDEEIS